MWELTEYGKRLYSMWREDDPFYIYVDQAISAFYKDYHSMYSDVELVPAHLIYDTVGVIAIMKDD